MEWNLMNLQFNYKTLLFFKTTIESILENILNCKTDKIKNKINLHGLWQNLSI